VEVKKGGREISVEPVGKGPNGRVVKNQLSLRKITWEGGKNWGFDRTDGLRILIGVSKRRCGIFAGTTGWSNRKKKGKKCATGDERGSILQNLFLDARTEKDERR